MMKQTIYLVDSENVNDAWVPLMPKLKRRDQILIFHTKNSPHVTTENASMMADYQNNLTWEKCFTGTNGLDFQLVTRLGYLICKKPRATFVIVSNDTGFDAAIKYWVQEGKQVIRIRGASCGEDAPLEELQEKIVLEDAPDKQKRRPRKKRKRYSGSRNQAEGQRGQDSVQNLAKGSQGQEEGGKSQDARQDPNQKQQPKQGSKEASQKQGMKQEPRETKQESREAKQETREPKQESREAKQESKELKQEPKEAKQEPKEPKQDHGEPKKDPGELKQEPREPKQEQKDQGQEKSIPVNSVLGICRSISMSRHELIHESLVALLGAGDGREVYYFLKDNQEFASKLTKLYLPERSQRVENYLQVIFDYHKEELKDSAQILEIINKHMAGDRNGIFQAMTEAFGHKRGARYYSIIKQHVRVLKKM